jgi:3-hydroxyacyl-CoA dehydrogenase
MINNIKTAAILGSSGTIGSLVGGVIAQEGIRIYFLSRTTEHSIKGLQKAIAQTRSEVIARNIICGDYDCLLEKAIKEADWVIEAVSENITIKRQIYDKIEKFLQPDTIISSTTSSLPLDALIERHSDSFRKNFLSTHFYNPPGKMLACEIAGGRDSDPEVLEFMKTFLEHKLRRAVIPVKNIAGFAGNRIAFLLFSKITELVSEYGVEMMDYLISPYTGRLMAPLATLDLVGLDIHKAIIKNLAENTTDEMHESFAVPNYVNIMIDKGLLGNKTKGGFYKRLEGGRNLYFDPKTCDYIPAIQPHISFVEKAKNLIHLGMYKDAFEVIKNAEDKEAQIVKDILCTYISYSYCRVGEVTETEIGIEGIDRVMSAGFHWASPSLILNLLGGRKDVTKMLRERKLKVPEEFFDNNEPELQILNSGKYFEAR